MYCQIAHMYMFFFLHTHAHNHVHVLTRNFSASGAKVGVAVTPTTFLHYWGVFCLSQVQDVKKGKTCKMLSETLTDSSESSSSGFTTVVKRCGTLSTWRDFG